MNIGEIRAARALDALVAERVMGYEMKYYAGISNPHF